MVNIILINWIIGAFSILLLVYSFVIVYRVFERLSGELKSSIFLLINSFFVLIIAHIIVGIFAAKNIDYNNVVWIGIPLLVALGTILFVIGTRKLFRILLGVSVEKEMVK